MEALKQIITIPATREIHIHLPDSAAIDEEAEIIVLFKSTQQTNLEKLALLQEAATDPLFLADLQEIAEDFKYVDQEIRL